MSKLEDAFAAQVAAAGLPAPTRELVFAPPRKWRMDFAWPDRKVAVEVDGGTWIGGRHSTGAGLDKDYEKHNAAALLGWTVLRFSTSMLRSGDAIRFVSTALTLRAAA